MKFTVAATLPISILSLLFAAPVWGGARFLLAPPEECAYQIKEISEAGYAENAEYLMRSKKVEVNGKSVAVTYLFPRDGKSRTVRITSEPHSCRFPDDAPSLLTELGTTLQELATNVKTRLEPETFDAEALNTERKLKRAIAMCKRVDTAEMKNAIAAAEKTLNGGVAAENLTPSASRAPAGQGNSRWVDSLAH